MTLQVSLNILQNKGLVLLYKNDRCCLYMFNDQYLLVPPHTVGQVPTGTLDTLFRLVYSPKAVDCQTAGQEDSLAPVVSVVLEKQGHRSWGRIERPGLLAIACGNTSELISQHLQQALTDYANYRQTALADSQHLPNEIKFDYRHDLTTVRDFFQQFKLNRLAEQTGISQELLGQFMANKQYPSTEQAQQIEVLIQDLGREMLNFSLI